MIITAQRLYSNRTSYYIWLRRREGALRHWIAKATNQNQIKILDNLTGCVLHSFSIDMLGDEKKQFIRRYILGGK